MSPTPSAPATPRSKLDHALAHARAGRPVFPCWPPTRGGGCACGKADCDSPGKHPIAHLAPNGVKHATTDEATIRRWWRQYPLANPAWATGAVVVLDVDPRHGGDDSLFDLERPHGKLPATPEARTGGGGRHILFAAPPGGLTNKVNLAPGLDLRGAGGYVIGAGSTHVSGGVYAWDGEYHPDDLPPAALPAWLLDACRQHGGREAGTQVALADVLDGVPEGQRDQTLFAAVLACHRVGVPEAWALRLALETAANCTPPYPAAKAQEKVTRLYGSYVAPPAPPVDALDDPSDDCPRCDHFRRANAALHRELWQIDHILANDQLSTTDRVVAVVGVRRVGEVAAAQGGDTRTVHFPSRTLGKACGVSPATALRAAQRLEEAGVWIAAPAPTVVTFRDKAGQERTTEVQELTLQLVAPRQASLDALAAAKPLHPRKHGGWRPRCQHHPAADVVKRTTWSCTVCGELITTDEETYTPPCTVFDAEPAGEDRAGAGVPTAFQDETRPPPAPTPPAPTPDDNQDAPQAGDVPVFHLATRPDRATTAARGAAPGVAPANDSPLLPGRWSPADSAAQEGAPAPPGRQLPLTAAGGEL